MRVWVSGLCVWPDSLGWSWPPAVAGVERVCKETAGGKANTSPVQVLGPASSDRFQNFPWSRVLARQACPDLHTWPTKSPESPLLSLCDEQVIYNPSVCVFLRAMGPGKENTVAVDLLCVALIKQSWEPSLLQITRGSNLFRLLLWKIHPPNPPKKGGHSPVPLSARQRFVMFFPSSTSMIMPQEHVGDKHLDCGPAFRTRTEIFEIQSSQITWHIHHW